MNSSKERQPSKSLSLNPKKSCTSSLDSCTGRSYFDNFFKSFIHFWIGSKILRPKYSFIFQPLHCHFFLYSCQKIAKIQLGIELFSSRSRSVWAWKNREFAYADFRSEGIVKKKCSGVTPPPMFGLVLTDQYMYYRLIATLGAFYWTSNLFLGRCIIYKAFIIH